MHIWNPSRAAFSDGKQETTRIQTRKAIIVTLKKVPRKKKTVIKKKTATHTFVSEFTAV